MLLTSFIKVQYSPFFRLVLQSVKMGNVLVPPPVAGEDLGIWRPQPWPSEHTDQEGKVQAYKSSGRYQILG